MLYRCVLKVFFSGRNLAFYKINKSVPIYKFHSEYSFNVRTCHPVMTHMNSCIADSFRSSKFVLSATFVQFIRESLRRIPQCLKNHSGHIVKVCTRQCEYVIAHRIKRVHQMFCVYNKLWDEVALRCLIDSMKQQLTRRGKQMLLGAVGVATFNWEAERIADDMIRRHMNELQNVHNLLQRTVTCTACHKRLVVDVKNSNVSYCECIARKSFSKDSESGWIPFIERDDLLIWRKIYGGLYAYKLYGNYNDVTAEDFLHVQIDAEYRKQWDNTALQLCVVESDPKSTSDVVYWEMQWPRMFSNRDYVFNRRYMVDYDSKMIVIMNQATQHPQCPPKPENFRVKEYWSYMVIKAQSSFSEPGIEFSLTYFDNAGVTIPSSLTTWVAISGLPDFMSRLRQAARDFYSLRKVDPKYTTVLDSKHKSEDEPSDEPVAPDEEKMAHGTGTSPTSSSLASSDTLCDRSGSYLYKLHGLKLFF